MGLLLSGVAAGVLCWGGETQKRETDVDAGFIRTRFDGRAMQRFQLCQFGQQLFEIQQMLS